jgi:hypothetical protein
MGKEERGHRLCSDADGGVRNESDGATSEPPWTRKPQTAPRRTGSNTTRQARWLDQAKHAGSKEGLRRVELGMLWSLHRRTGINSGLGTVVMKSVASSGATRSNTSSLSFNRQ